MGELVIDLPNGADSSKLQLTEVLYFPEVGYTLVSISHLDEKGFSATFSGGKCTITGPDGKQVGEAQKIVKDSTMLIMSWNLPAQQRRYSHWINFTIILVIFQLM